MYCPVRKIAIDTKRAPRFVQLVWSPVDNGLLIVEVITVLGTQLLSTMLRYHFDDEKAVVYRFCSPMPNRSQCRRPDTRRLYRYGERRRGHLLSLPEQMVQLSLSGSV